MYLTAHKSDTLSNPFHIHYVHSQKYVDTGPSRAYVVPLQARITTLEALGCVACLGTHRCYDFRSLFQRDHVHVRKASSG